jgi:hypothetical protein
VLAGSTFLAARCLSGSLLPTPASPCPGQAGVGLCPGRPPLVTPTVWWPTPRVAPWSAARRRERLPPALDPGPHPPLAGPGSCRWLGLWAMARRPTEKVWTYRCPVPDRAHGPRVPEVSDLGYPGARSTPRMRRGKLLRGVHLSREHWQAARRVGTIADRWMSALMLSPQKPSMTSHLLSARS